MQVENMGKIPNGRKYLDKNNHHVDSVVLIRLTIFHCQVKDSKDTEDATADVNRKIDYNFLHAFFASISVIIVSELGDKTFFIAAIMAMRHSRVVVFLGAIAALGLMTVLSVFLGYATTVIPRKYTFYISTALFALFGLKMLKEGYDMDPNEGQEELEEVSAELKKKEAEVRSLLFFYLLLFLTLDPFVLFCLNFKNSYE